MNTFDPAVQETVDIINTAPPVDLAESYFSSGWDTAIDVVRAALRNLPPEHASVAFFLAAQINVMGRRSLDAAREVFDGARQAIELNEMLDKTD